MRIVEVFGILVTKDYVLGMKVFRFKGQSEARKKLGAPKKQLQQLWNRPVTLRHIISLLDQIEELSKFRGELDTKYGGPSYLGAMLRRFYNVCGVFLER
ncbi:hypothetical protein KSS87_016915 [Heliosperma pusillum]|nr:hypothetical protein KSS87_016915 [Heliosperma pusillum]